MIKPVAAFAPIVLTVYNRPDLLERTVAALQANHLACESDLFVFSDGPKNRSEIRNVRLVRALLRYISGFKSVAIAECEFNRGLARSVISGVTEVLQRFGRAIVVEDDLLTSRDFLTFMNAALLKYEENLAIYSISGFNFGLQVPLEYPYDALCFYRSSSLGWATWKNRWDSVEWNVNHYHAAVGDESLRHCLNRAGDDLAYLLYLQAKNRIDSWAIRWAYTHVVQQGLSLLSTRALVEHIGSGAEATHSRRKSFAQLPLTKDCRATLRFPDIAFVDPTLCSKLQTLLRPSAARKAVRFLKRLAYGPVRAEQRHSDLDPTRPEAAFGKVASDKRI